MFNDSLGVYGAMQQDGRIEGFDVMLFDPNGAVNGCIQIHGSAEQVAAVREDDEFKRTTIDAVLIADDLRLVAGYANEGVAAQMSVYQEAISKGHQRD